MFFSRNSSFCLLGVICALNVSQAVPIEIKRWDGEIRQDTVVYKTLSGGYKLYAIVHYPREWSPTDKRPVFVGSYGSGWNGGQYGADPKNDKFLCRWEPKCDDMAIKGMVSVRYDYRSPRKTESFPNEVSAMVSDARSIVRWIRRNAGELGVDTGRICGAGGSSAFHIMVSGTVLESTRYNQPGENTEISPKAHALVGFTGALCSSSGFERVYGICPDDSIKEGSPPFLGIVGEKDSWRIGAERYAAKAYKLHIPSLSKVFPNGEHDFHVNMFGHGSQAGYDSSMRWAQDFLFSIGHMDLTVECRSGESVSLKALSQFIQGYCSAVDTLESSGNVQYTSVGNGGKVDAAGVFTSNGRPGLYQVTARSARYPHIFRNAVIRVPVLLDARSASSIVKQDGFTGIYAKVKALSGKDALFNVRHGKGNSVIKFSTKSLSDGFYYIGSFPFDSNSPGSITISGTGGESIDSILLVPAYPGVWKGETSSTIPGHQSMRLKPLQSGYEGFEIFSLSGRKLAPCFTFPSGKVHYPGHGAYIIRSKHTGQIKMYTTGSF